MWLATLGDSKTLAETWQATLMGLLGWASTNYSDLGVGSATVASALAANRAALVPVYADYALCNWGVNDIQGGVLEADFKAAYLDMIDAIHVQAPGARIGIAQPWYRNHDAACLAMAGWVDDIVALRSSVAFVGHDENIWMKGADDGATMTTDGVHYSVAGSAEVAAQWMASLVANGWEDGGTLSGFMFNRGAFQLLNGDTTWTSDTIKARLVTTAAGAPSVDADVMTGIGTAEASGVTTLGSCVGPTLDDASDLVKYHSADAVFTAPVLAIGACDRLVVYKFVTNDADSIPLFCVEIPAVTPNSGDVTVVCPSAGWACTDQQP